MKQREQTRMNRSSRTALGIAAARALERERPPAERIVDDPFARHFVGEGLYRLMTLFDKLGWSERRGAGVLGYLMARERAVDETLTRMLDAGIEQLVILGAGYDARAYRFARRLARVRVFEVDHPATQAVKRARVAMFSDEIDLQVEYVPVDFAEDVLSDALQAHGYDPARRTLFIWQGVMMYLEPDAIDATLRFVRTQSGPGSAIVLDYVAQAALEPGSGRPEIRKTNRYARSGGERIRTGLDPARATAWLEARGFVVVEHLTSEVLHARYFTGANAARAVSGGYGLLVGRVPESV